MCLTIYLGADKQTEQIPWDSERPRFNVRALSGHRSLRRRLQKPYLYEIGAHTGCGCGFLREDDDDGAHDHVASIAARSAYLTGAAAGGTVELLVCWIGDEKKEAESLDLLATEIEGLDLTRTWEKPIRVSVRPS